MGVLRLILSINVILAHTGGISFYSGMGGTIAVQDFFIISGFYMSLILNEKYIGKGMYKVFLRNRFLKLFPTYWVVLFLMILANVVFKIVFGNFATFQVYVENISRMSIGTLFYLIFTNIFIFGQDAIMFLKLNLQNGGLSFTPNFAETSPRLFRFLLIPQAWSLGVELLFYMVAPLIVRRRIFVVGTIILMSIGLRIFIYSNGWNFDPWSYRFFPTEIALFLFGNISYKIYRKIKSEEFNYSRFYKIVYFIAIGLTISYQFINSAACLLPAGSETLKWFYYLIIVLSTPFLFEMTKRIKIDGYLGELSYPIYIVHMFLIYSIGYGFKKVFGENYTSLYSCIIIVLAVLSAFVFVKCIINPIEALRQKKFRSSVKSNTNENENVNIK